MRLALARLPLARLTRAPRAWGPVLAWTILAIVGALLARSRGGAHPADHALGGPFGAIALPLLAYAVVGAALGGKGLAMSGRSLVAFGASPVRAALSLVLVATIASASIAGPLGAIVAALSHGAGDPALAYDVATSFWIGALGGAVYAAFFSAGASFGKGTGRGILLAVDFFFGAGGASAVVTPRAHVRSLFGGPLAADLSQRASVALLVLIGLASTAIALFRSRRSS